MSDEKTVKVYIGTEEFWPVYVPCDDGLEIEMPEEVYKRLVFCLKEMEELHELIHPLYEASAEPIRMENARKYKEAEQKLKEERDRRVKAHGGGSATCVHVRREGNVLVCEDCGREIRKINEQQ